MRSWSVSGRVNSPGVKVAPAGITIKELIDDYCDGMLEGHTFKAYLPGGCVRRHITLNIRQRPFRFRRRVSRFRRVCGFPCDSHLLPIRQHARCRLKPPRLLHPREPVDNAPLVAMAPRRWASYSAMRVSQASLTSPRYPI